MRVIKSYLVLKEMFLNKFSKDFEMIGYDLFKDFERIRDNVFQDISFDIIFFYIFGFLSYIQQNYESGRYFFFFEFCFSFLVLFIVVF